MDILLASALSDISPILFGVPILSGFFILMVVLWTLYWKISALWAAARHGQRIWFVAILVVNTVGILEIIYLVWFRKDTLPKHTDILPLPPFEAWKK